MLSLSSTFTPPPPPPFPNKRDAERHVGRKRKRKEVKKENQPLMTDAPKLPFVLRVRLDAQAGRQHELGDRGAEAGEEGVERLWFFVSKGSSAFHARYDVGWGMWMGIWMRGCGCGT